MSDLAARQAEDSQRLDRLAAQARRARPSAQAAPAQGGFVYVDPHVSVFTSSGTGAGSLGSAQSLDLSAYVPAGARVAHCSLRMTSSRSGGDASDSQLYAEWLPDGGTDWLTLGRNYDVHELTDDATVDDERHCLLPIPPSRTGYVRVFEALDDWEYTLTLFGHQ